MSRYSILWIFLFNVLSVSTNARINVENLTSGVSKQLSTLRKAEIKDVSYTISFAIPENKNDKVTGKETISFSYKGTSDVILDFKADIKQVPQQLTVNKRLYPLQFKNEHIIIPSSIVKEGINTVQVSFISGNKSLNRNDDYLYTLFVPCNARTVFPCFDQPDIKATYSLTLDIPSSWTAISNESIEKKEVKMYNHQIISFKRTKLLPTYLFSFVAGKFQRKCCTDKEYSINAYYRETDSAKVAQLPKIFNEVLLSLHWLEQYTGIKMPFEKYDFIILPGFQFGGMEHAGAIQYNDKRMFLSQHPTADEELARMELIAHETTHLWFGDMVTMKWFNDVWTKEVFANYMADKITKEQFPQINHELNFLKSYQIYALEEDRTKGTHPIQQPLDNLKDAGLVYGNIIYEKAPVMMKKLEKQMGSEYFRIGLQKYLKKYAYGNATWDNLIDILEEENKTANVKDFSEVWVKQKGMPFISVTADNHLMTVVQEDPYKRNILWRQQFKVGLVYADSIEVKNINMQQQKVEIPIKEKPLNIITNTDGEGYGFFINDISNNDYLLRTWKNMKSETTREAMLMNIYESYQHQRISAMACYQSIFDGLTAERNELIASTCCNYLSTIIKHLDKETRAKAEKALWLQSKAHHILSCRQKLLRTLITISTNESITDSLYNIWYNKSEKLLNEDDYMNMSYQLAIRRPAEWKTIINKQATRLTSADRKREFEYICRGCTPDRLEQDKLFNTLLQKENRSIEPWAQKLLTLLNHPLREPHCNKYIMPGLNALQEIQRTGDIFFPKNWLTGLLSGHQSAEAQQIVKEFISNHPHYPIALKNKLLQVDYELENR